TRFPYTTPFRSAVGEGAALDGLERAAYRRPGPRLARRPRPVVEVVRLSAVVHHGVDRARPPHHLAARPVAGAVAELRRRSARVAPVNARIEVRAAIAEGNADPPAAVAAARLEHQHPAPGRGEPRGEHAARRTRADDDVVVRCQAVGARLQ